MELKKEKKKGMLDEKKNTNLKHYIIYFTYTLQQWIYFSFQRNKII